MISEALVRELQFLCIYIHDLFQGSLFNVQFTQWTKRSLGETLFLLWNKINVFPCHYQLLARLLKSSHPEDLQAANRLIKTMVRQVMLHPIIVYVQHCAIVRLMWSSQLSAGVLQRSGLKCPSGMNFFRSPFNLAYTLTTAMIIKTLCSYLKFKDMTFSCIVHWLCGSYTIKLS